ncbi:MAG: hypothetical protein KGH69_00355 [Candidatus Micrarchaeota archaeon]|nr:hypothetical protein [Candidatus Micrarchaeota archaeon]
MAAPYVVPIVILGIAVVAVVVGIEVVGSGSSSYLSALPQMPNTGEQVPQSMSGITSVTSQQATSMISALVQAGAGNLSSFHTSYSGTLSIKPSGLVGAVASVNSPLHLDEYGSDGQQRMDINASSLSLAGKALLTYVNETNSTYVCTNLNISAILHGQLLSLLGGPRNNTCYANDSVLAPILGQLYYLNISQLSRFGMSTGYDNVYQSEYRGVPCTYVHGLLSGLNGTGEFGICLSDSDNLPVTMAMLFSNKDFAISLQLNQTGFSTGVPFPGFLPGPLS